MLASIGVSMYNFSLKRFFEGHDSYIPETITRYEDSTHIQDYSDDHAAVAATCKRDVNYTCQKCGVRCAGNRHLLHLHHQNGDKFDNYPSNLLVLCVECHSREPKHDHLRKQFRDEIDLISKLRKEQGILDLLQH
jgi:5-methylcytosine-specific restriction endonuclease McrA